MYCKSRTNGVGLWDPRVGNMTYPEPYLNPLRRLYPGMSKGSSYWGGSLSGFTHSLGAFSVNSAASYNATSAGRYGWGLIPNSGFSSPGDPNLARLVYEFQKTVMGESQADGKIGPKTLTSIARLSAENPGPPAQSSPLLLAFVIKANAGSEAEAAISRGYAPQPERPAPRTGGGGGAPAPTPRRSMSDGDEMNLDFNPPPKPKPKKSSVPMIAAIGGGLAIAAGLFFMSKKD
jgi:hypothetical protein